MTHTEKQRTKFHDLQTKWQQTERAAQEYRTMLDNQYSSSSFAPKFHQDKMESLYRQASRARERMYTLLDKISPRNWRYSVPCGYVCNKLTYEDATTAEQLATVPDPAYGHLPQDMQRFAMPVPPKKATRRTDAPQFATNV